MKLKQFMQKHPDVQIFKDTTYFLGEKPKYYPENIPGDNTIGSWEEYEQKKVDQHNINNNLILGSCKSVQDSEQYQTVKIRLDREQNLNTLVIGGSGSGKTLQHILPNIEQMNCSMIVSDPGGEVYTNTAKMFFEAGYKVWRFDAAPDAPTDCYNPLDYVYDADGSISPTKVARLVTCVLDTADVESTFGGDPFWEKSAKAWLSFAIFYVLEFLPLEQRNFSSVLKIVQLAKPDDNSSRTESQLEIILQNARQSNPKAKCFQYYDIANIAPAKTFLSLIISTSVALCVFADNMCGNVAATSYVCKRENGLIKEFIKDRNGNLIRDEHNIDLAHIGDRKTIVFVIEHPDSAYNCLYAMLWAQLLEVLTEQAEYHFKQWVVRGADGVNLAGAFANSDEARAVQQLYASAEIFDMVDDNGEVHYYIRNLYRDAFKTNLPERYQYDYTHNGIIEEVFSKQVGKDLIAKYQQAEVIRCPYGLPIHTRLYLDEFGNIAKNRLGYVLATSRRANFSTAIFVRSIDQLQYGMANDRETADVQGNCDIIVWMGSSDEKTAKMMSKYLGTTIIQKGTDTGKIFTEASLATATELMRLMDTKCVVCIRGCKPMLLNKLNPADFANHRYTGFCNQSSKISDKLAAQLHPCFPKKLMPNYSMVWDRDNAVAVSSERDENKITKEELARFLGLHQPQEMTTEKILLAVHEILKES